MAEASLPTLARSSVRGEVLHLLASPLGQLARLCLGLRSLLPVLWAWAFRAQARSISASARYAAARLVLAICLDSARRVIQSRCLDSSVKAPAIGPDVGDLSDEGIKAPATARLKT